jgi:fumarylacetoacetase
LPDGEVRTFLADGDTVILRAFCERAGLVRIGFGECAATVQPAAYTVVNPVAPTGA